MTEYCYCLICTQRGKTSVSLLGMHPVRRSKFLDFPISWYIAQLGQIVLQLMQLEAPDADTQYKGRPGTG
jgi:hypothetical protein